MLSSRMKAELALVIATLVWGLTFPFVRIVLSDLTPAMIVFLRGGVSSLIFAIFVFAKPQHRKILFKLLPVGICLGVLYYVSYFFQSIGLQTISSGRSAFLTNLTVVFVPLLSPIFKTGKLSKKDIISCLIALIGMFFLTNPLVQQGFAVGDLWSILCAFFFAVQIQFLHVAMWRYPHASLPIAFLQLLFLTLCASFFLPFTQTKNLFHMGAFSIFALGYLSVVAMVITTWIQTRYQHQTTPERASIIYILEPVFASLFGFLLLAESMTPVAMVGGFLMILSVVWPYGLKIFVHRT